MATAIEGICPRLWRIIQGTRTEVREYGLHLDKSLTPGTFVARTHIVSHEILSVVTLLGDLVRSSNG